MADNVRGRILRLEAADLVLQRENSLYQIRENNNLRTCKNPPSQPCHFTQNKNATDILGAPRPGSFHPELPKVEGLYYLWDTQRRDECHGPKTYQRSSESRAGHRCAR